MEKYIYFLIFSSSQLGEKKVKIWHLNDSLHTGFVSQLDFELNKNFLQRDTTQIPQPLTSGFQRKYRWIRGKSDEEKWEILHIWGATEERLFLFPVSLQSQPHSASGQY